MKHHHSTRDTILAIDLGSTTFKTALFDMTARVVRRGACPLRPHFAGGGRVEIPIEDAVAGLRQAVAALQPDDRIAAIAITSQAQTFTLLDKHHAPATAFISWQDAGDADTARQAAATLHDFQNHCSFFKPGASLQMCQIKRCAPAAGMMMVPLPSYFIHMLTGRLVTDDNIAAMSGLYSLETGDWWDAALDFCGLHRRQLPDLAPVGSIAGKTTANPFGIPAGRPVFLAGNDQTAGAYGAEVANNDRLLLTLGTALAAYSYFAEMPAPAPGLVRGPYPGRGYYRMATDGRGGNVLNWARGVIAGCASDEHFFGKAALAAAASNPPIFECDLNAGQGAWRNLSLHHGAGDMAYAVIHRIGNVAADLVQRMPGWDACRGLLAAGGGSRQPLLLEIIGGRLGKAPEPTDAAPLHGAARMAGAGA